MTQQLDMVGLPLDDATTRRIALPQPRYFYTTFSTTPPRRIAQREVLHRRLRDVLTEASRFDVGHEVVLPERAREDHR